VTTEDISVSVHLLTYTIFNAYFPGKPGLAACALVS